MNHFFLSIGSNISPEKNIPLCLKALQTSFPETIFSSAYETDPVGPAGNLKFWNLAAMIPSRQSRDEVISETKKIEYTLGRRRTSGDKYAPRTIDIDILPQEDYQKLAFIIIPLAEIAPDEIDPKTGLTFKALAERQKDAGRNFKLISLDF
ncbi:MAG: 2-amino-4-hydroxy-6-hydroxymethyldihydropteridine diphosphokinase [Candidatus Omnitrophica bacterium]|nr:2-amino-4-hydroxy-6-hydroxymethyldihydropteridine diphosphokinase [Candidatus Omnitrophota bacterium]